jgi:hypothetical protein
MADSVLRSASESGHSSRLCMTHVTCQSHQCRLGVCTRARERYLILFSVVLCPPISYVTSRCTRLPSSPFGRPSSRNPTCHSSLPSRLRPHARSCNPYTTIHKSRSPSARSTCYYQQIVLPLPTRTSLYSRTIMPANLRTLGKNGPKVPALGFGLMGMSYIPYGSVPSDEERFALLDRAVELGATFWDTSE